MTTLKDEIHRFNSSRPDEAKEVASKMLGHRLFTKQTGREGKPVSKIIMCEKLFTRREYYFAREVARVFSDAVD